MPLVLSGDGITSDNIASLAASKLTGQVPDANAPPGSVVQVVNTIKTDTFSTTVQDNTFADITGLSASITPISASSKILVMVNIGKAGVNNNGRATNFRILRDSTAIGLGDSVGSRVRASFSTHTAAFDSVGRGGASASHTLLDNPSTTSAITYKVQMSGHDGDITVINRSGENVDSDDAPQSRSSSTITLMEISG
jgi:hypothetical protein